MILLLSLLSFCPWIQFWTTKNGLARGWEETWGRGTHTGNFPAADIRICSDCQWFAISSSRSLLLRKQSFLSQDSRVTWWWLQVFTCIFLLFCSCCWWSLLPIAWVWNAKNMNIPLVQNAARTVHLVSNLHCMIMVLVWYDINQLITCKW